MGSPSASIAVAGPSIPTISSPPGSLGEIPGPSADIAVRSPLPALLSSDSPIRQ